jgi:hypothetical protein
VSAILESALDDERRAACAVNDAALGTQQPRELRPFRILIGKRGEPRLDFGAMSVDSVSAVMQHMDLCTVGERCEALPVRGQEPQFLIAGRRYTLAAMLAENADDEDFCAWARAAVAGDRYEVMHAEPVRCVAGAVS